MRVRRLLWKLPELFVMISCNKMVQSLLPAPLHILPVTHAHHFRLPSSPLSTLHPIIPHCITPPIPMPITSHSIVRNPSSMFRLSIVHHHSRYGAFLHPSSPRTIILTHHSSTRSHRFRFTPTPVTTLMPFCRFLHIRQNVPILQDHLDVT